MSRPWKEHRTRTADWTSRRDSDGALKPEAEKAFRRAEKLASDERFGPLLIARVLYRQSMDAGQIRDALTLLRRLKVVAGVEALLPALKTLREEWPDEEDPRPEIIELLAQSRVQAAIAGLCTFVADYPKAISTRTTVM